MSFNNDYSSFDFRRDRVFSKNSFSLRSNEKRPTNDASDAVSSFLNAFESHWNVEPFDASTRLPKQSGLSSNGKKTGKTRPAEDWNSNDEDDRKEFDRLRQIAGNLANGTASNGNKIEFNDAEGAVSNDFASTTRKTDAETNRRVQVAQKFVDRPKTNAEREFDADSPSARDEVDAAFRLDGPPDATATIDGKAYYYFGGDGYLGLQADPEMLASACEAALKYGLASATSRRCFVPAPVKEVERNAAKLFGVARAFYSLNEATVGELLLKSILASVDRIFVDDVSLPFWTPIFEKLARLDSTTANVAKKWTPVSFRRGDALDLREKMRTYLEDDERPLAITDGVFADCGTISPLDRYVDALEIFPGAALLINDSQGVGVLGANGRGTFEHFHFDLRQINRTNQETSFDPMNSFGDDPLDGTFAADFLSETSEKYERNPNETARRTDVRLYHFASLAKAVGGFGCVAAGSELFVEKMTELSDDFAASIPSNPIAAATARGLRLLATVPETRERLRENVERLRAGLREIGLDVDDSPVPIVAFQRGSQQNMRRIQRTLAEKRILISFLPTRNGKSRGLLRIAVFATHTPEAIDALIDSLREILYDADR